MVVFFSFEGPGIAKIVGGRAATPVRGGTRTLLVVTHS